jgi:hypothetical protein
LNDRYVDGGSLLITRTMMMMMTRALGSLALASLAAAGSLRADKCEVETQLSMAPCTASSFGCDANGTMCASDDASLSFTPAPFPARV